MAKKLNLDVLPDEVREIIKPHVVDTDAVLHEVSEIIGQKRAEAKAARATSGIEEVWTECEKAYLGVDEANAADFVHARWAKPLSMDGPVFTGGNRGKITDHKSTAFVRLTARYVDAGTAKLGEILLPAADKSFSFSEMPDPELLEALNDKSQVVHDGMGNVPLTRAATPEEMQAAPAPATASPQTAPGQPPAAGSPPPQVPLTPADLAQEKIDGLRKKAKAAEDRIYGWMVDCRYRLEMRKVIFDAARIGTGVVKGPFPKPKRSVGLRADKSAIEIEVKEAITPAVKWVDAWNIFPDPACGENITDGDYVFERDWMSERQVRQLKRTPGYLVAQIDEVIKEGPDKAKLTENGGPPKKEGEQSTKGRYEIWYYYGSITARELDAIERAAGKVKKGPLDDPRRDAYVIVTMVNDRVIRAVINPLDSGELPYHAMPWQRRSGHWAGVGVGEQLFVPQKMLNAATRAMLNNAGKSAGTQIVIDGGSVRPADGNMTITPDKVWVAKPGPDGETPDVTKAFGLHKIPNVTPEMMQIVEYSLKLAEESTSIPLITQGQTGQTTPDTLGATQLQDSNANQLLRSIGYAFDDYVTEPLVLQYYEWLLLDPDVPDEEKGEFKIDAHGSVALVERAIQDQTLAQVLNVATNPAYKADPAKTFALFLKSKKLNPDDVQYTPEERKKIEAQPPPAPPQVQVAQINAESRQAVTQATLQAKGQSDQQRVAVDEKKIATEATIELHNQATQRELLILEYALKRNLTIDQVKADLAQTTMKLTVEKQLNAQDNAADHAKGRRPPRPQRPQPMRPPVQTPGRAGNGRAFEQGPPQ